MRGDVLIIQDHHRKAAREIVQMTKSDVLGRTGKYLYTIAGESGAGKSEIASALKTALAEEGIESLVIQQDDYFEYPPKTNAARRIKDIGWVGPQEVRLDLLDENLADIAAGKASITKPLVIFREDMITSEAVDVSPFRVIIIDGTYTSLLKNIDCRVFIDRDNHDTRADRLKRNREKQDDFLEQILEIEHGIISKHKKLATIIIDKDFNPVRPI